MIIRKENRHTMFFGLVISIFLVQLVSILLSAVALNLFIHFGIFKKVTPIGFITIIAFSSVSIGTVLSLISIKILTKPFQKLMDVTTQIATGNFAVRLELHGPKEAEVLADNFNMMAKELDSIETLRSDFISNVSHEFKTPIASIKGFAKILKKDTLSTESRNEYLDIIIKESDRLAQLSGNVLLLSKLEKQASITEKNKFLLDEQLRRAALVLEQEWKRKNITISAELPECSYVGNEELLMQVWINLIGNAIKFTDKGGEVSIKLARGNDEITVQISDTGIGMNDEIIGHIFDKFYQGDISHNANGNGLGLALVKQIIKLCGSHIAVESEEGKGTTIYVTLPANGS